VSFLLVGGGLSSARHVVGVGGGAASHSSRLARRRASGLSITDIHKSRWGWREQWDDGDYLLVHLLLLVPHARGWCCRGRLGRWGRSGDDDEDGGDDAGASSRNNGHDDDGITDRVRGCQ